MNLAEVEQHLHEMAGRSVAREKLATLVQSEFIPSATAFSALANQIVRDQVTDMQSGVYRLSGNLDGIVLFSGIDLRARAEAMNGNALKEAHAGLYASLFTKALHNFSEFLLTENPANVSKTRTLEQELQTIEVWKVEDFKDPEPRRSVELKQLQELEQSSAEFHDYADRIIEMVRRGRKDRAINFVEKTFEPLINTPPPEKHERTHSDGGATTFRRLRVDRPPAQNLRLADGYDGVDRSAGCRWKSPSFIAGLYKRPPGDRRTQEDASGA
jgi:hypothetical protein